jgi:hypothetical protein
MIMNARGFVFDRDAVCQSRALALCAHCLGAFAGGVIQRFMQARADVLSKAFRFLFHCETS